MKDLKGKLGFLESVIWNIAALCLYQCMIQFAVYPQINSLFGAESYGNALTLISVMTIFSYSVGSGANYSRIVMSGKTQVSNGDYNSYMFFVSLLSFAVSAVSLCIMGCFSVGYFLSFSLLLFATSFRCYAEVEYRLSVNFRRCFIFYVVLCIGYAIGLGALRLGAGWEWSLTIGEILTVVLVVLTGTIFKGSFFKTTPDRKTIYGSCTALIMVNILSNFILNSDRLLINIFKDGTQVSVFYTASLIGKSIALLVVPLSSVMLSYLTKYNSAITKKMFALFSGGSLILGAVMFAACMIASPILIKLLYPDIFEESSKLFGVANLGQIFYFVSNLLLVIALRFMREKVQLYINLGYTAVFFALGIPALTGGDLRTFAWAVVAANLIRLIVIIILGTVQAGKVEPQEQSLSAGQA